MANDIQPDEFAKLPWWKIFRMILKYSGDLSTFERTKEGLREWLTAACGCGTEIAAMTPTDIDDDAVALLSGMVEDDEQYDLIWNLVGRWVEEGFIPPQPIFVEAQNAMAAGLDPRAWELLVAFLKFPLESG